MALKGHPEYLSASFVGHVDNWTPRARLTVWVMLIWTPSEKYRIASLRVAAAEPLEKLGE